MVARIIAHHPSSSLIYLPAWIVDSIIIVRGGVSAKTSVGIVHAMLLMKNRNYGNRGRLGAYSISMAST